MSYVRSIYILCLQGTFSMNFILMNSHISYYNFTPLNITRIFAVDIGRKLDVHKTFRRRPGRRPGHLLNVFYTSNLRPVSKRRTDDF